MMRQRATVKTVLPPSFAESDHHLEGGSICVDTARSRGFAASADIGDAALRSAAEQAAAAVKVAGAPTVRAAEPLRQPALAPLTGSPTLVSNDATETLRRLADACLSLDHTVRNVRVMLDERITRRLILSSDGFAGTCRKVLTDVVVECRLSSGHAGRAVAGVAGHNWTDVADERLAREAVDMATANAHGTELSPARVTVVLEAGWCAGVFLHELIGHQLEADNVQRGWSRLSQNVGPVCQQHIRVSDAPGRKDGRGSMSFDDEGCPSLVTRLIWNGTVVGYLHDTVSARRAEVATNGHARRQDYRFPPLPRMTNLVAECVDAVETGPPLTNILRVASLGGGQVNGETGRFIFDVLRADRLLRGEAASPVSGIALTGNVRSALSHMTMSGPAQSDRGRGVCLKEGQAVPIGVTAPTILVEDLEIVPKTRMAAGYSL